MLETHKECKLKLEPMLTDSANVLCVKKVFLKWDCKNLAAWKKNVIEATKTKLLVYCKNEKKKRTFCPLLGYGSDSLLQWVLDLLKIKNKDIGKDIEIVM